MPVKLPSGGKLSLAAKCLGSVILPQVVEEIGEVGQNGIEQHAKLEKFFKGQRKEPEDSTDEDRELYRRLVATIGGELPELGEWAEHGGAVDAIRLVQQDYIYSSSDDSSLDRSRFFPGIADLIQRTGEYEWAVWDWKSSGYVPEPKYNWQLILSGLRLFILSERDAQFRCSLGIVYTGQPTDDGKLKSDVATFDAGFFERKRKDLGFLQRRLESADPKTVKLYSGKHCKFCPARHRCPAIVGAFSRAVAVSFGMKGVRDEDVISASRAYVDNAPQLSKMEKEILKRHGGELDLGDGRIAVLETKVSKSTGKVTEKVYTKHGKYIEDGSNASEDGKS